MSIVNYKGHVVLDTYVAPTMQVRAICDLTFGLFNNTYLSLLGDRLSYGDNGDRIRAPSLEYARVLPLDCLVLITAPIGKAVPFNTVQTHVANTIKGKVLVGHSIWNDLSGMWRTRTDIRPPV